MTLLVMDLTSRLPSLVPIVLASILLASCGGGGGGSSIPTAGNPEPPRPPSDSPGNRYDDDRYDDDRYDRAPIITDSGTIDYLSYGLWNEPAAGESRNLRADILSRNDEVNPDYVDRNFNINRDLDLTYQDNNGFVGIYSHEGRTGKITSDVLMKLRISNNDAYISDFRIGTKNSIVIEGQNLGRIDIIRTDVNSNGMFRDVNNLRAFDNILYSSSVIEGALSSVDTNEGNPRLVAGEVKVRYGDIRNRTKNSLVGVFTAGVEE